MKSLRRFWKTWFASSLESDSSDPPEEPASATIARFLLDSRKLNKPKTRANHRAFMPPPDLRLSTFNVDGLEPAGIWAIGERVLSTSPQPTLHGRADVSVAVVKSLKLRAVRDNDPIRHVSVVNWPELEDAKARKAAHKAKAQKMAEKSSFRPYDVEPRRQ